MDTPSPQAHLCFLLASVRLLPPPPHSLLGLAAFRTAAAAVQQRQVGQQALDGGRCEALQQRLGEQQGALRAGAGGARVEGQVSHSAD